MLLSLFSSEVNHQSKRYKVLMSRLRIDYRPCLQENTWHNHDCFYRYSLQRWIISPNVTKFWCLVYVWTTGLACRRILGIIMIAFIAILFRDESSVQTLPSFDVSSTYRLPVLPTGLVPLPVNLFVDKW